MRRIVALALVAVASISLMASSASAGFGLHRGSACCDPAPVCCEAPAPTCCEVVDPCCPPRTGLLKGIFGKLHNKIHHSGCCDVVEPACGCEMAAPVCAPAPVCCPAPAPTCCEVDPCCPPARKHHLKNMLAKIKAKHSACCAPAPCCETYVEPSCGCGH